MRKLQMNELLAKNEQSNSRTTAMIRDYVSFFKTKQGAFRGEKNTYQAREGFLDKPEKRNLTKVQTTVDEKLKWFEEQFTPWLTDIFSVEATNSKGASRVELVVGGHSFGFLSAPELMRLRNILTNNELSSMYTNIPVRSDSKIYEPCTDEEYEGRSISQTPLQKSVERTTEKEEVILRDPNIDPLHMPANYRAQTTIKSTVLEIGDSTHQEFTGEWTQRAKAELLRRKSEILEAVTVALKQVNAIEAEESNLNAAALIDYLHYGK